MSTSRFAAFSKALILVCAFSVACFAQGIGTVLEFPILYPAHPPVMGCSMHHGSATGSTHEITFNEKGGKDIWITGQNEDKVVRVTLDGKMMFYDMPLGSGPHGIEFDADGRVWVTLEFAGKIVRLDQNGRIDKEYDVRLACATCPAPLDSHPHGMGFCARQTHHLVHGKSDWYGGQDHTRRKNSDIPITDRRERADLRQGRPGQKYVGDGTGRKRDRARYPGG